MAKNSTTVMNSWTTRVCPVKAKAEAAELQKLMDKEGKGEKLEAKPDRYYTENYVKKIWMKKTKSSLTLN